LNFYADDTSSRTDHAVTLTGLMPETKYYYSIGTTAGTIRASTNYYFFTAPPQGASRATRIWFLSDYGNGDGTQTDVRDEYLAYLASTGQGTDLWLTGGDNEQSGLTGADSAYQTTAFNVYSNIFQNTPVFPCPGNHDGGSSSAYWTIYDLPYQGQAGGYASGNAHYYSFDYGNIHFISLDAFNTSTDVGSPMLMWLTNDLASTTQAWIIAYWHAPVYCKVFYDSDSVSQLVAMRQNFAPLLESYGVDVVLTGHSHSLQRTSLLKQHYGSSTTFSPTNKVDGGNGRPDDTGAYLKPGRAGHGLYSGPNRVRPDPQRQHNPPGLPLHDQ
jgi:acid phosphatase type 7